jgi:hypothetical protein
MSERPGYERLWGWFGLSRASWLSVPRVLMHEMPDEWQEQMAALLEQLSETFPNAPLDEIHVSVKERGKFVSMPDWIGYRYPDKEALDSFR